MCGRYAAGRRPEDLVEEFEVERTEGPGPGGDPAEGAPDFNVAPTKPAPVVLERASGADVVRWMRLVRWGLVPSWAKDLSGGARMINARAETLLEKPAFRRAAVARRCLVPADGWYEWQVSPVEKDPRGKPWKQPFYMTALDGSPLAMAGLYEFWRDPAGNPDDPAAWVTTFAVITTAAEPGLDRIHDRMPLVLSRDRWRAWLDPAVTDPHAVSGLLTPPAPGRFGALPVSRAVNAVANNGPHLVDPAPLADVHGAIDPWTGEVIGAEAPLF